MPTLSDRIASLEKASSQRLSSSTPDFSKLTDEQLEAEIAEMSKSLTDDELKMFNAAALLPGQPWMFLLDLIDKRVPSLDERWAIGKRVITGKSLDDDLQLFAELDRFFPSSLLDIGLNTAMLLKMDASFLRSEMRMP